MSSLQTFRFVVLRRPGLITGSPLLVNEVIGLDGTALALRFGDQVLHLSDSPAEPEPHSPFTQVRHSFGIPLLKQLAVQAGEVTPRLFGLADLRVELGDRVSRFAPHDAGFQSSPSRASRSL